MRGLFTLVAAAMLPISSSAYTTGRLAVHSRALTSPRMDAGLHDYEFQLAFAARVAREAGSTPHKAVSRVSVAVPSPLVSVCEQHPWLPAHTFSMLALS